MAERAVHGFERGLRAHEIALQPVHRRCGACRPCAALVFHSRQELGETALDSLKLAEARTGSVELLHQPGDAALEIADGRVVAARILQAFDLVGQALDDRFELRRHAAAVLHARLQRLGDMRDTLIEDFQRIAVASTASGGGSSGRGGSGGHLVDLRGEPMHLAGQMRQRFVGGDMRDDALHRRNGGFQLLESIHVRRGSAEPVDLLRQVVHGFAESIEIFRRPERAQCVEHFRQSALDRRKRLAVGSGLTAVQQPFGKRADFRLKGLDGALRHGVEQGARNLAQRLAQGGDAVLQLRLLAQRLDLAGDVAQMLFQPREILRRDRRRLGLGLRRLCGGGRALRRDGRRIRIGVERLHPPRLISVMA